MFKPSKFADIEQTSQRQNVKVDKSCKKLFLVVLKTGRGSWLKKLKLTFKGICL